MAKASVHLMNIDKKTYYNLQSGCSYMNVGSGEEITIKNLAETIAEVIGFKGNIDFDTTKPDGSPRKILDSKLINNLGFKSKTKLKDGLITTYQEYLKT